MSPIFRSIRLKYGIHNLCKPITDCSCTFRFTIICSTPEIETFWDKRFMFKESIEVISLLKTIFPTRRKLIKDYYLKNILVAFFGFKSYFLTRKQDGWSASCITVFQPQQPKHLFWNENYLRETLSLEKHNLGTMFEVVKLIKKCNIFRIYKLFM